MTWNCRIGGFRYKAKHVAAFRPDVLAVQEVEPIDTVLLFGGEAQPTCRDRANDPAKRHIGMFSYTDTVIEPVDEDAPMYSFRRYKAQRGDLTFHIAAVWTVDTESRGTAYMQAHEGLTKHADWIRQRPTVILGDFNDNASYRTFHWQKLLDLMAAAGLLSAYHAHFNEPFGAETRPTHFHGATKSSPFHLDYCFVPEPWAKCITNVQVGEFEQWHTISDHMPLIVDLEL